MKYNDKDYEKRMRDKVFKELAGLYGNLASCYWEYIIDYISADISKYGKDYNCKENFKSCLLFLKAARDEIIEFDKSGN